MGTRLESHIVGEVEVVFLFSGFVYSDLAFGRSR